jgi:hypothetical protein
METNVSEIKIKGKPVKVQSILIDDKTLIVTGKSIMIASVHDEDWLEGQVVENPEVYISELKEKKLKADIFTFAQKLPDTEPRYKYHMEWDNAAAIATHSFKEWWEKRLPQVTRKSVRRGSKRGVIAKVAEFNDELVQGIVHIHNETLMKQGRAFAHYGKNFNVVKQEYGTYLDRSEFLGAYLDSELIGIIKLVYMGKVASIMQIISKERHYDKRPMNVLIAKAVEVCEKKEVSFLTYGSYVYGNKTNSSLTEFKRRNGFVKIDFPRYYIPLTLKGTIAIKCKLHLGLIGILPGRVINFLRDLRSRYYQIRLSLAKPKAKEQNAGESKKLIERGDGEVD